MKIKLYPTVKHMSDRELLEKLIIAVADHPQMEYYLRKHGLIETRED